MAPYTYLLLGGTLTVAFLVHRILGTLKLLKSIDHLQGHRNLINSRSVLYFLLPEIKYITPGRNMNFREKHSNVEWLHITAFKKVGWDAYAYVSWWPSLWHHVAIADASAIKDIAVTRRYPKPDFMYEASNIYGPNIVSAEGEQWKKYRKISMPSFSEKNNKLVWEETLRIVDDLIENVWEAGSGEKDEKGMAEVEVENIVDVTLPLALLVISAAGFGQKTTWVDSSESNKVATLPSNHNLTFRDALHTTVSNVILNTLLPNWMKNLTAKWRKMRLARVELKEYMREMIHDRQTLNVYDDSHDLLSSLIRANQDEGELSEDELMGNIFIFLVAGHETTAHSLAFTLGLLALYPDIQEKLFEHIRDVIPNGRRPVYEDMQNLTYAMAVYYETLRMFPPLNGIPKMIPEDTSILVGNSLNDEKRRIPLPKGTSIALHVAGLHYNPRYWKNPEEYNPDRFLGDWDRDALITFSVGPRACIGRKFNETETIAVLVSIISRYEIKIKEEPEFKHETFEERKARALKTKLSATLTPKRLPLTFRRRKD